MLLPAANQQDNKSARSGLPEAIRIKALPNFAAEFLTGAQPRRRTIRSLELPSTEMTPSLGALQVDGTAGCRITETGLRAEKLRRFAQDCSWAIDHVYFGGEGVAQNRQLLKKHGITHVVNCVRLEVQNLFDQELKYCGLYLQDSGAEDIIAVLYDVFDFIEEAKECHGNVYVHCSQGVSRSAALVIAYVMWRKKQSFEITKDQLKRSRGVVDPNVVFCWQLMSWEKRFHSTADGFLRVYRIASQSERQPSYLVPKLMNIEQNCSARQSLSVMLDPRGTFVIHGPGKVFIWIGSRHLQPYLDSAKKFARQLSKYEHAPVAVDVHQGYEPTEFFALIADQTKGNSFEDKEQETFTADYERFSQSVLLTRSMESDSPRGVRSSFRRVFSES